MNIAGAINLSFDVPEYKAYGEYATAVDGGVHVRSDTVEQSTHYPIVNALPSELHSSPYQPAARAEQSNALNALVKSIREFGLQYPPLVTRRPDGNGYTIVDGHRRVAAIKNLAWLEIPVLVSQGRPEALFSAVSGTTKPLTAAQWVEVYLSGGEVPSGPTKTCISRLDEVMGRDFLQKICGAGLSPQIWNLANRMVRYITLDDSEKPKVLAWLLEKKQTRQVAAHLAGGHPVHMLRTAFEQNVELRSAT